ncbi:putative agmatinase 1 [Colletotrichum spinosum]|uniref:Putative agmatinase 1 n=1 Tax=Colletotrichum spinosum TaxID=1347390 RepID=A0A4R8QGA1_9PEZI|nr:putative agmatinase 1 [Colletotrichum spinosum]
MHLSPAAVLIVNCVAVAAWHLPHPALANSPHQISLTLDKSDDDDFDVTSADSIAGLRTFANLPFVDCFSEAATNQKFDIAVFGAPHDTVSHTHPLTPQHRHCENNIALRLQQTTTGRPGARFGPPAIRTGSQRKGPGEWSVYTGRNPLQSWATVVDCGDASLTWLDNTVSLKRLDKAHKHLILNNSIHAGIRAPLIRRKADLRNDVRCGFEIVTARDIDKFGMSGVILRIKDRVRDSKVYISVDIDVLDPAYAPATGTAEPGGWSTRELLTILEGLEGLAVVGGDVVEVAPAYDNNGETTVLAAAEIAYSLIDLMVVTPVRSKADLGDER